MRTKKRRGNKPGTVTLTEGEVIQACCEYAERKGFKLAPLSYLRIVSNTFGRPRKSHSIAVVMELKNEDVV